MKTKIGLPKLVMVHFLFLNCQSTTEAEQGKANDPNGMVSYLDVTFAPQEQREPIIPNVVYNYLGELDLPDSLLLDTSKVFANRQLMYEERKKVNERFKWFKKQSQTLPDFAEAKQSSRQNF